MNAGSCAHIDAIVDAGGDVDHDAPIVAHTALTTALLTGSGDHITLTTTAFTHRDIDKLTKDRLLNTPDLSGSLTGRTPSLGGTRLCTTSLTTGTGFDMG